jgi:hypothetical protein
MTAFMTAAPTILEHTGRQTRGHAGANRHEKHRNLEFPDEWAR